MSEEIVINGKIPDAKARLKEEFLKSFDEFVKDKKGGVLFFANIEKSKLTFDNGEVDCENTKPNLFSFGYGNILEQTSAIKIIKDEILHYSKKLYKEQIKLFKDKKCDCPICSGGNEK